MIKKYPKLFIALIATGVLIIAILAYFVWGWYSAIYIPVATGKVSVSVESATCDPESQGKTKTCNITFKLTNRGNEPFTTDLNGINGPGAGESGIQKVHVVLDDNSRDAVFVSVMPFTDDEDLQPHQTKLYGGHVEIPTARTINKVQIYDATQNP